MGKVLDRKQFTNAWPGGKEKTGRRTPIQLFDMLNSINFLCIPNYKHTFDLRRWKAVRKRSTTSPSLRDSSKTYRQVGKSE